MVRCVLVAGWIARQALDFRLSGERWISQLAKSSNTKRGLASRAQTDEEKTKDEIYAINQLRRSQYALSFGDRDCS